MIYMIGGLILAGLLLLAFGCREKEQDAEFKEFEREWMRRSLERRNP